MIDPLVLGILWSSQGRKRGKTGLNQSLIHLQPIPPHWSSQFFLLAPPQLRSQKKKTLKQSLVKKILIGICSHLALPIMPMHASLYDRFGVFTAMNKNSYQPRYNSVYFWHNLPDFIIPHCQWQYSSNIFVTIKTVMFCIMTPSSTYSQHKSSWFLWNISNHLEDYMMS